jgi:hypothetical protein
MLQEALDNLDLYGATLCLPVARNLFHRYHSESPTPGAGSFPPGPGGSLDGLDGAGRRVEAKMHKGWAGFPSWVTSARSSVQWLWLVFQNLCGRYELLFHDSFIAEMQKKLKDWGTEVQSRPQSAPCGLTFFLKCAALVSAPVTSRTGLPPASVADPA